MSSAPPKRTHFSLNLNSEVESFHKKVEDLSKDPEDKERVQVLESTGPSTGSTHVEYLTKPFEKIDVTGTVKGKDRDAESEDEETRASGSTGRTAGEGHWTVTKDTNVKTKKVENRSSTSKKNRVWENYDTSDL